MKKKFFSYVIPSILGFALSGVYAIVDGFFIGNSIGDAGLAAISIAYPITAFLQAMGTGIGMGGAVHFSISFGRRDYEAQKRFFSGTILLMLLASILTVGVLLLSSEQILRMFGAKGELLILAEEYIKYIIYGAVFQILGTGLVPIIRNTGSSFGAMTVMIAGFLTNIILDYLLVWVLPYGMAGAAVATIIGQAVTMLICIALLLRKRIRATVHFQGRFQHTLVTIFKTGISPFGLTFLPNITLIFMNKSAMIFGGESAVVCYAVIAYITAIIQLLLQGVGDGSQPLISIYYGEKVFGQMRQICKMAYGFATAVALGCMAAVFLLRGQLSILFGTSEDISQMVYMALPFFIAGFLFVGVSRTTTSYFYATHENIFASILIYIEPALLLAILSTVPRVVGLTGVWLAVPLTQMLVCGLSVVLMRRKRTVHSFAVHEQ